MNKKRAQIVPEKIQATAPFFLENQSILTPPHNTRKKETQFTQFTRTHTHNYALKEELYKIINSRERGPPRKSANNEEEREE